MTVDRAIRNIRRWQDSARISSNIHLNVSESDHILTRVCPTCEFQASCEMTNNGTEKICLRRSSDLETVWVSVSRRQPKISAGDKFGYLTVLERCETPDTKHVYWWCRCVCGNEIIVRGDNLLAGRVKSCMCMRRGKQHKKPEISNIRRGDNIYIIEGRKRFSARLLRLMTRQTREFHSHVGCKVEECIDVKRSDGTVAHVWITVYCPECGGIVRYNKHDLKQCDNCGLIVN